MTTKVKLIPFNQDGHLVISAHKDDPHDWRPNYEFKDELRYTGLTGYKTLRANFSTSDGKEMSMYFGDFKAVISKLVSGRLEGTFTFIGHGGTYAVKLVEEA